MNIVMRLFTTLMMLTGVLAQTSSGERIPLLGTPDVIEATNQVLHNLRSELAKHERDEKAIIIGYGTLSDSSWRIRSLNYMALDEDVRKSVEIRRMHDFIRFEGNIEKSDSLIQVKGKLLAGFDFPIGEDTYNSKQMEMPIDDSLPLGELFVWRSESRNLTDGVEKYHVHLFAFMGFIGKEGDDR